MSLSSGATIVPLHEHTHLLHHTAELLNHQWSRSLESRKSQLSKSCDDLPIHFVLLTGATVIGHIKLARVQDHRLAEGSAVLVESLLVHDDERGKGYGRLLMSHCHQWAARFKEAYLNTKDKCEFYAHLGYELTSPVTCLENNASHLSTAQLQLSALAGLFGSAPIGTTSAGGTLTWMKKPIP